MCVYAHYLYIHVCICQCSEDGDLSPPTSAPPQVKVNMADKENDSETQVFICFFVFDKTSSSSSSIYLCSTQNLVKAVLSI